MALLQMICSAMSPGSLQRCDQPLRISSGELKGMNSRFVKEVRGKGLLVGVELVSNQGREFCEKMLEAGILCKETRDNVVRFAPPLTITKGEIDVALEKIELVLRP